MATARSNCVDVSAVMDTGVSCKASLRARLRPVTTISSSVDPTASVEEEIAASPCWIVASAAIAGMEMVAIGAPAAPAARKIESVFMAISPNYDAFSHLVRACAAKVATIFAASASAIYHLFD
ncbi:hypothetical protein [Sphingobium sp. TCM1]|uniref:hypothetical protein n=1 Tax=Sphingobium sp. TCM1 TaxID=453246 RepID=UPI001E4C6BC0|nr:hypothetical protein [Sphingobium sp. TCM1]